MPLPRTITDTSKRTTDEVSKSMSTFFFFLEGKNLPLARLCLYTGRAVLISAVIPVPQHGNSAVNQTLCSFAPAITLVLLSTAMPTAKKLGHRLLWIMFLRKGTLWDMINDQRFVVMM